MGNHRKTMRVLCVVHAAKVMMISGSAVTCARNGSMASAWRSPQPKRNTSSSTSAPPAQAARGPRFESRKPEWPTIDSQVRAAIDSNTLSAYCRRWCLRIHLNLVSVLWLLTDCCSVCGLKHLCSVVYWIVCFRFQLCHVWSFSRFKVRFLPFPDWVRSSGTQRNLSEKVRPNWCPAMHDLVLWKCWCICVVGIVLPQPVRCAFMCSPACSKLTFPTYYSGLMFINTSIVAFVRTGFHQKNLI